MLRLRTASPASSAKTSQTADLFRPTSRWRVITCGGGPHAWIANWAALTRPRIRRAQFTRVISGEQTHNRWIYCRGVLYQIAPATPRCFGQPVLLAARRRCGASVVPPPARGLRRTSACYPPLSRARWQSANPNFGDFRPVQQAHLITLSLCFSYRRTSIAPKRFRGVGLCRPGEGGVLLAQEKVVSECIQSAGCNVGGMKYILFLLPPNHTVRADQISKAPS